jgi:hypothetical protein
MKNRIYLVLAVFSLLNSSCLKNEIPIDNLDKLDLTIGEANVGSKYGDQVYYNLNTNEEVFRISKYSYDLKVNIETNQIFLNSSLYMQVAKTQTSDIRESTSITDLDFTWDHKSLTPDSNAIGNWWESDIVYVFDKGTTNTGADLGEFKAKFSLVGDEIHITSTDLDGSNVNKAIVKKNSNYNHIGYSREVGEIQIEPEKYSWDLLFTQYMTLLDGETDYLVTGVLTNIHETSTIDDELLVWEDVSDDYNVEYQIFNRLFDNIGYDWKTYSFDSGMYEINTDRIYLIKTQNDQHFKLRFIGFYTSEGEKGNISFEYEGV